MASKKGAKKGAGKGTKKGGAKKGGAKKGGAKKGGAKKGGAGKGGAKKSRATSKAAPRAGAAKRTGRKASPGKSAGKKAGRKGGAKAAGKRSARKGGGGVTDSVVGAVTGAAGSIASTATGLVRSAAEMLGLDAAPARERAPGQCLSLMSSDEIVEDAVRRAAPGIGNIDFAKTLEEHSIFTESQRTVFRQDVFNRVHDRDCEINMGEIPNDADSVLRDISATVKARAR